MSIKLVDTLESMGNFPVANADGIQFTDGESLQKKLDDGSLGGGGATAESYIELSEEEYLALSDEERASEVEYRTYDTGRIFKRGVEFGKETDISSKQDSLSQVKFTMRRNSASDGRYCLIGSSDLSQNLLMCEPYRFQGIFGDGTTSVENKSIIDFMVSFREGVGNPDEVLSGFANSSKGFEFVDLLITVDETTNMAYAYVDFKTSGSVATGEITKPVLEAESYMDFAESFELTDTYIGTLVCKMSDYCKVITNIDDTTTSTDKTWSSSKIAEEVTGAIDTINTSLANYSIPLNLYMGIKHYLAIKINIHNMNYSFNMSDRSGNIYEGAFFSYNGSFSIQITKVNNSSTKNGYILGFRQYKVSDSEIYLVAKVSDYNYINGVINTPSILKSNIEILVNDDSTLWDKGTDIVVSDMAKLDDSSTSETSTWSSSKIAKVETELKGSIEEINDSLVDKADKSYVDDSLGELSTLNTVKKSDANECVLDKEGQGNFYIENGGSNLPNNEYTHWYINTVAQNKNAQKQVAYSTHTDRIYIRKYVSYKFSDWQELATMDKVESKYEEANVSKGKYVGDLNDIPFIKSGVVYKYDIRSGNCTNTPVGTHGILYSTYFDSDNYCLQEFHSLQTNKASIYRRDKGTGVWSDWQELATTDKLGGLSFSASGTTLSITDGTNTWTLEANS